MLSAMLYVLRTGIPWRDLPPAYGPWQSVYTRFRRWTAAGLFARILTELGKDARGGLRHVDYSHIKLHQHGTNPAGGQEGQAIGRTNGGLNTKLAAVVDGQGRAVAVSLAPGPRHDPQALAPILAAARRKRLVADKGFAGRPFQQQLQVYGTRSCIPPKHGHRPSGPFHRGYYRCRHRVEDSFCRIKANRRISTRYDKLASTLLAFVQLAAITDWLTHRY